MVLFIVKKNAGYGCYHGTTGLWNSAKFVVDMLRASGVKAGLVEAVDNNCIDRLVSHYCPDIVVIEALWVVPEKFDVLRKLHPKVQWVVRLHSDTPFLAGEGIAVDWMYRYLARDVQVAFNSPRAADDFRALFGDVLYLPNYYPVESRKHRALGNSFRVGCFGAIRPMKNQLLQAIAAIRFADENNLPLEFWVNASRCEEGGSNILKNLRALFSNTRYTLVETPWLDREEFLSVMSCMSVALCDSFSETFCITAADAVNVGTPLVCSSEIPWASSLSVVPTTSVPAIVEKMSLLASPARYLVNYCNRRNLKQYSEKSRKVWLDYVAENLPDLPKTTQQTNP